MSGAMPNSAACDQRYERAARADSCITSPSCPVSVRPELPGRSVASMKRSCPPISVQAMPVATPGGIPLRDAERGLARDLPDGALHLAHARLARVARGDEGQRLVRDFELVG